MNMRDAWNSVEHGEAIINPATGTVIHKWMEDKPGQVPGFTRFLEGNVSSLKVEDVFADTWEPVNV